LTGTFLFWFFAVFLLFVEFFFFDEFKSRYNTVAVDYLRYPQEVFLNIGESYHVGIIVSICLVIAVGWVVLASSLFPAMWERHFNGRLRFLHLLAAVALIFGLSRTFPLKGAHVGSDRTLNEIANNGVVSFGAAA